MTRRTRKRLLVAIIVLLLVPALTAGAWFVRQSQLSRRLADARSDGMAAFEAGDYEEALSRLSYYVGRVKDDGEAILAYAESRERVPQINGRHLPHAVDANRLAAQALPGDIRPLVNILGLQQQMGYAGDMVVTADQILALDPGNAAALRGKARGHFVLGQLAEARTVAEALLEKDPTDAGALTLVVESRRYAGDDLDAIERWLSERAAGQPGNLDILLEQARVQSMAGRREDAVLTLRRAAETAPADPAQLRRLASTLDAAGMLDETERLLARAGGEGVEALRIERAWKGGRMDAARERALEIDPAGDPSVEAIGWAAVVLGPDSEAARALAAHSEPDAARWRTLLDAAGAIDRGEAAAARDALFPLTQGDADGSISASLIGLAVFEHARALAALGSHVEAVAEWESLASADPSWVVASAAAVNELSRVGRPEQAFVVAHRALRSAPTNSLAAGVYLSAMVRLAEAGLLPPADPDELRAAARSLRESVSEDPDMLCLAARAQIAWGESDDALETIDAIEASGLRPSASSVVQLVAASIGSDEAVRRAVGRLAASLDGAGGAVVYAEALAAGRAGRLDEGLGMLDEAIASATGAERLQLERARARYLQSMDQRRALAALRELAEREAQNAIVQLDLLEHRLAWEDASLIDATMERLGAIVGRDAATWRLHDARRLLTFEPSGARAGAALLSLTTLIEEDPYAVEPRLLAAQANIELHDRAAAIETLTSYLDHGGRDASALVALIPLLRDSGRWEPARQMVSRLADMEMIPTRSLLASARTLDAWGDAAGARRLYMEASAIGLAGADEALVDLGVRTGDASLAADAVARLEAAGPATLQGAEAVALFRASRGDPDAARAAIASAPGTEDERALALARVLERVGTDEDAMAALAARAEAGGGPDVWAQLASMQIERHDFASAGATIDRALATHAADPTLLLLRGVASLGSGDGDPAAALAVVKAGLAEADVDPAYRELIEIFQRRTEGRIDQQRYVRELEDITGRRPTLYAAWASLVRAHVESGRMDLAAAAARSAAAAMPLSASAQRLATETLAGARQFSDALAAAERWRRLAGDDRFEADVAVAELEGILGRPERGVQILEPQRERILAESEERPGLAARYGELLANAGRVDEARSMLEPRVSSDEAWALSAVHVGRRLVGDPAAARAWLAWVGEAAAPFPALRVEIADAWRRLASRTSDESDYRAAAAWFERAAETDSNPLVRIALADCQNALGLHAEAEASYRAALSSGEDPIALNNLAALIASVRPTDPEAVRSASRALELARSANAPPDSLARFIDTVGYSQLRAGRPAEAKASFSDALRFDPTLADSVLGLAECAVALGEVEEARRQMRRFSDFGPSVTRDVQARAEKVRDALASGGDSSGTR